MNVKTFIDRPILAGVISVIILLLGFKIGRAHV